MQAYGLGFSELNTLQEYGLIVSPIDIPSKEYRLDVGVAMQIIHQNLPWALVPKDSVVIRVPGVVLSGVGRELLPIVDVTPNEQFTKDLRYYFVSVAHAPHCLAQA